MRVLVVSNLYPPFVMGGYEVNCAQMVQALRNRGHDVLVLSGAPRLPLVGPVDGDDNVLRILRVADTIFHDHYLQGARLTRRLADASSSFIDAANVFAFSHAIDSFRPDVIYVWNIRALGGLGLLAAADYRGVPWVCHLADALPQQLVQFEWQTIDPLARAFERQLVGTWIACSQRVVDEIEFQGPRLRDTVELVPAWLPDAEPLPAPEAYRAGDELRLVFSGWVSHHKGIGIVIEALSLLRGKGLDQIKLDLIGVVRDGDLVEQVRALGLTDSIRFLGALEPDEVLPALSGHHVFVFLTHEREPFGIAPLEGAWAGCVPVISDSCGVAEWLVDGVHCVKARASAPAFARVLEQIIAGEIDLGPLARRARASVMRDFCVSSIATRVEPILERAAARAGNVRGTTEAVHRAALLAEHVVAAAVEEATI